jgi:SPP1 gp7 family putative phage head morphogenesis protein
MAMLLTKHNLTAKWMAQHGAAERSLSRSLRRYFTEQAERIAEAAGKFNNLTTHEVHLIFRFDEENAKLLRAVRVPLGALMLSGAQDELRSLRDHQEAQKSLGEFGERFDLSTDDLLQLTLEAVPQRVRDAIRQSLNELTRQAYWQSIQDTTRADLRGIIESGIAEGISGRRMANRIRDGLQDKGRSRADMIARTETTGALNAGHAAAMEHAAAGGGIQGKEWLSIIDDDTRSSHVDANGQVVAVSAMFNVGASSAPYPGHWSLPAGERVRCRCTFVSVVN